MKIRQKELSCSMQTDEQMDRQTERHDEANSLFLKFAKATRNRIHIRVNITMKRFPLQKSSITYLPKGISCILLNTKFPWYVYNIPPSDPITSQFNPVQNPKPNFCSVPS